MLALRLENALRKLANSGDSEIVRGQATGLEDAIGSEEALERLVEFVEELVVDYEESTGTELSI